MQDSADLLDGWPIDEVLPKAPAARQDVYGVLYFYLREVLFRFCHHFASLKLDFQLFQVNALRLPKILDRMGADQRYFDRIEVRIFRSL